MRWSAESSTAPHLPIRAIHARQSGIYRAGHPNWGYFTFCILESLFVFVEYSQLSLYLVETLGIGEFIAIDIFVSFERRMDDSDGFQLKFHEF
jgi:hypothetical protein